MSLGLVVTNLEESKPAKFSQQKNALLKYIKYSNRVLFASKFCSPSPRQLLTTSLAMSVLRSPRISGLKELSAELLLDCMLEDEINFRITSRVEMVTF